RRASGAEKVCSTGVRYTWERRRRCSCGRAGSKCQTACCIHQQPRSRQDAYAGAQGTKPLQVLFVVGRSRNKGEWLAYRYRPTAANTGRENIALKAKNQLALLIV